MPPRAAAVRIDDALRDSVSHVLLQYGGSRMLHQVNPHEARQLLMSFGHEASGVVLSDAARLGAD